VIAGRVRGVDCAPLAGCVLDVWHADARGGYDNDGYHLRGTLLTDEHGRYELRTIVPGRYLNGKRYRPAHIHVKLRAADQPELTTQLYFAGDRYLDGDPFVVDSLILAHARRDGVRRASFDFVLQSSR
jgi:protocatechuate 3,4-dioxygenase beta subunit